MAAHTSSVKAAPAPSGPFGAAIAFLGWVLQALGRSSIVPADRH